MLLILLRNLAKVDLVTSECFDCGDVFGHGRFQHCLFILTMVSMCAMHCHTLVFGLISGDVDHWCKQPQGEVMMSAASWRNVAIPLDPNGRFSRCTVYVYPGNPNDTRVVGCHQWDYDPERVRSTIVSQWDLVCNRRPLLAVAQAVYIAGSLLFMSFVGLIADRVGRLPVLLLTVAVLQLATMGGCFAAAYHVYVLSRFLNSGCVATVTVLSSTLLFEASTHKHRSLHLCAAMTVGVLMAEGWFAVARLLRELDWIILQSLMLSPTVLTLYAFTAAHESPRWYVAKKDIASAEMVMLSAAKENHFPLTTTACMVEKLKEEVAMGEKRIKITGGDFAGAHELRHRALVMFSSSFAVTFTMFATLFLDAQVSSRVNYWFQWASNGADLAGSALLILAIRRITAPRLLVATLGTLGGIAGLISLTFTFKDYLLTSLLFLLVKPLVYACNMLVFTTVMSVGAAAVRCATICWLFGFGRLGGACAAVLFAMLDMKRGDVLFALAGTSLFGMTLVQLSLPPKHDVLILSSEDPTSKNKSAVDYMKHTLDTPVIYKRDSRRKSRVSIASSRAPGSEINSMDRY
ncbi:solute carrier family 22 member 7-like [Amblyomma americanum]